MKFNIVRYETVGSTNAEAVDHARRGGAEGLCIIAREQTQGRGRYGREWVSARNAGLYLSLILRPALDKRLHPLITLMAGIAVHDALEDLGLDADIKWVNDLFVNERKIGGILAEAIETPTGPAVIVGIGVNLTGESFPDEIANTATAISTESAREMVAGDLVAESICKHLSNLYDILNGDNGPSDIISGWGRRSTYFRGKAVRVTLGGDSFTGITDGLEHNGALRVITSNSSVTVVQAGDVERLRPEHIDK